MRLPPQAYRPVINVPYAEETMHGFEYQAAIHMMMEGMLAEGTELIEAVRERYDDERRNPWNEFECGSNYARSMASYAVIPALSGFQFDATRGMIGFFPLTHVDTGMFRCPWSLDSGWGEVEILGGDVMLRVLGGCLFLHTLRLPFLREVAVMKADGQVCEVRFDGNECVLNEPVRVVNQAYIQGYVK